MKIKELIRTSLLLLAVGMFVACGSEESDRVATNGKVDMSKTVKFKIDFADYNADTEVQATRTGKVANDTISKQCVDLGNNLLAEVTVQRDTAKSSPTSKTRALEYGIYTMMAYQGGGYKGEVTGAYSGGEFMYKDDEVLELAPGTYDFVLYNQEFTRNGNELTLEEVNKENALIGRATYTVTATPRHQQVTFQMKHAASRVRCRWISGAPIVKPFGMLGSKGPLPFIINYQPSTDTWNVVSSTGQGSGLNFTDGSLIGPGYDHYGCISNYVYYLPYTPSTEFRYSLGGPQSTTYNGLPISGIFENINLGTMTPNSSFLVTFKLKYNFLYLMSDGSTDFINSTQYTKLRASDGVTPRYQDKNKNYITTPKIPVGMVLSQSKHLAVALKNANNNNTVVWTTLPSNQQFNNIRYAGVDHSALSDMNGYRYTWEGAGSADGTTIKANSKTLYPAFYYAGHYGDELTNSGISVSGTLATKKWYLPSFGEWKYLETFLPNVNRTIVTEGFTQVGGNNPNGNYWASTELWDYFAGYNWLPRPNSSPYYSNMAKYIEGSVRPFIHY